MALRAFLQDHYERDKEIRFNQIELRSDIFDLFIDVPIDLHTFNTDTLGGTTSSVERALAEIAAHSMQDNADEPELLFGYPPGFSKRIGAASLLLHHIAQNSIPQIVIEGAPGQGKSTIVQYVCQMHRYRLLDLQLNKKSSAHDKSPIRLPFRIDCRDLSTWLSNDCPFKLSDEIARNRFPTRTVESFLAAQITEDSGGIIFDVDDLLATIALLPTVIFYDGLDEVADIKQRHEVVDAIEKGTNRIQRNAPRLQTVVTSRPAFANSSLPERTFPHLHLGPIGRDAVKDFASRWLQAQNLSHRESEEFSAILESKLDQAHIGELARNPMQLSILLSLIRSHGASLPDMRTKLYDSYVERAFNREAEKSSIVRDHRTLFEEIHRYVAWVLHNEAERGSARGRIDEVRLKSLVQDFLTREGHHNINVEDLFVGMVERIVALVSRIEGTFEFEVQPLREYFAAKYLYLTAPYSPAGSPKGGTKPERFDAMARNFFWHNVTRFYAGCYDQGELSALVESLNTLVVESGYRNTGYPQQLTATLLAVWVFAQYPLVMGRVIPIVLDNRSLRQTVAGGYRRRDMLRLPAGCGNEELVERCFDVLATDPPEDFRRILIGSVNANSTMENSIHRWRGRCPSPTHSDLMKWMENGLRLGVLSNLPDSELEYYLEGGADERLLLLILSAGRLAVLEHDEARVHKVIDMSLRGPQRHLVRSADLPGAFISTLQPQRYLSAFVRKDAVSLRELWSRYNFWELPRPDALVNSAWGERCGQFVSTAVDLGERYSCLDWATTLEPWKSLVSVGRRNFGEQWAWFVLANTAAGIKSSTVKGTGARHLFDEAVDLCERVRFARLQGRSWRWWDRQLRECNDSFQIEFALLIFFSWAGKSVFERLAVLVDEKLRDLDTDAWERLWRTLPSEDLRYYFGTRLLSIDPIYLPADLSTRFVVAIAHRIRPESRLALYEKYVYDYQGDDLRTLEFSQEVALHELWNRLEDWERWLPVVARTYSRRVVVGDVMGYGIRRVLDVDKTPRELVEEIVNGRERYPAELVDMASDLIRTRVASNIRPLGSVAEDEGWFSERPDGT